MDNLKQKETHSESSESLLTDFCRNSELGEEELRLAREFEERLTESTQEVARAQRSLAEVLLEGWLLGLREIHPDLVKVRGVTVRTLSGRPVILMDEFVWRDGVGEEELRSFEEEAWSFTEELFGENALFANAVYQFIGGKTVDFTVQE